MNSVCAARVRFLHRVRCHEDESERPTNDIPALINPCAKDALTLAWAASLFQLVGESRDRGGSGLTDSGTLTDE
jgi:hypothetical protein